MESSIPGSGSREEINKMLNEIEFLPGDFEFAEKDEEEKQKIVKSDSMIKSTLNRFRQMKGPMAGVAAIILIILMAAFGPYLSGYRYDEIVKVKIGNETYTASNVSPTLSYEGQENGALQGKKFLFGTDSLGRDLFTRTLRGTRISLLVAFVTIIINLLIGLPFGLISGYKGGMTDTIMQRFAEIINSIPGLVIISVLAVFIPKGIGLVIVAMALMGWVEISRITRASTLEIKEMEYVYASRTLGSKTGRILFKTIFPNAVGPIMTNLLFAIPGAIFTEAFLSFLGVGITLPDCSLGSLMADGFANISFYPYQIIPQVLILAILMVSFNAVGEGFEKALAPSAKDM